MCFFVFHRLISLWKTPNLDKKCGIRTSPSPPFKNASICLKRLIPLNLQTDLPVWCHAIGSRNQTKCRAEIVEWMQSCCHYVLGQFVCLSESLIHPILQDLLAQTKTNRACRLNFWLKRWAFLFYAVMWQKYHSMK